MDLSLRGPNAVSLTYLRGRRSKAAVPLRGAMTASNIGMLAYGRTWPRASRPARRSRLCSLEGPKSSKPLPFFFFFFYELLRFGARHLDPPRLLVEAGANLPGGGFGRPLRFVDAVSPPLRQRIGLPRCIGQAVARRAGHHDPGRTGERHAVADRDIDRPRPGRVLTARPITSPLSTSAAIAPRSSPSAPCLPTSSDFATPIVGISASTPRWQASPNRRGWERPCPSHRIRSGGRETRCQRLEHDRQLAKQG